MITLSLANTLGARESYYGNMQEEGYISVPQLILKLIQRGKPLEERPIINVSLEPV